ncbi:hypothetical protein GOP47_0014240 [Adiantum capillus-veneris]|uniref:ACB domain-containing protein n=1 Tax=Adiantum capillus-veneris TaxID=13818 RepID=A0A9D4ULW6_ADICA|nr:hypothetical protein GOP47_0014240 [Adiantum capillus-veneris]
MADWLDLLQFWIFSLIFAYMVVWLISVVQSFRENKLRIQRYDTEALEVEEERVAPQLTHTQAVDAHSPPDETRNVTSPKVVVPKEEEEEEESLLSDDEDWEGIDGSDLDKAFGKAASYLEKVVLDPSTKMSNEVKLQFYALYKQATEGPCSSPQPPAFRLSARAKWNAWKGLGDLSPEEAMQRYIALLSEIWPQWNQDIEDEVPAGSSEDPPTGSSRKTPSMGPVFSTMLSDVIEQEGLDGIHKCAKAGDLIGLKKLLQSNAVVDEQDGDGRTALHWATDQGHLEIIKFLLSQGAEINARDFEGQTALHYATTCEWEGIAAYLLESGADPSLVDNDGFTPYDDSFPPGKESADVK